MNHYVEIKTVAHGQPRAYADNEYIQELVFTRDDGRDPDYIKKHKLPKIVPNYVDREKALAIARAYCPYVEVGSEGDNWAARHLVDFEMMPATMHQMSSPGWSGPLTPAPGKSDKWKIHVRSTFTD